MLVEVLERARNFGDSMGELEILRDLGAVLTELGNFAEAEGYLLADLRLVCASEGALMANLDIMQRLGELRVAEGELVAWAEWLGFVVTHEDSESLVGSESRKLLEGLRDRVPVEEWEAAVSRGERMTFEDVGNVLRFSGRMKPGAPGSVG